MKHPTIPGRVLLIAVLGLAAALGPTRIASPARHRATVSSGASDESRAHAMAKLVNRHRAHLGRPRLVWDDRLAAIARAHSADMARRGYFSHEDRRGHGPFDRLREGGVRFRAAAENIAFGDRDAEVTLSDWIESPGHRRNLEDPEYTRHGVGVSGRYWTHVFVRPR